MLVTIAQIKHEMEEENKAVNLSKKLKDKSWGLLNNGFKPKSTVQNTAEETSVFEMIRRHFQCLDC